MAKRTLLSCLLVASTACAGDRESQSTTAMPDEISAAEPADDGPPKAERPAVSLQPSMHPSQMTEVVLDALGRAAITLDANGEVRLWPDLLAEAVSVPYALPVQEPVWMSLARRTDGRLVAGFIDTAGGARVGRFDPTGDRATWTPLFEVPSTMPLFELHVLDGGKRILALTVDHRILLWNAEGQTLAEIDAVGFVPWQLRVAQRSGAEPTIVAVLANPVRVQAMTLDNDSLAISGEALSVDLDRGPNHNDLTLTPDGKKVLALQRPSAKGKRFEVEVIDLASGDRRIVAAETDVALRPRLHPWDGHRVLLETGSGTGFVLDLEKAGPWPLTDGQPDRKAVQTASIEPIALPASTEASMFRSIVAGGRRFVPTNESLVMANLDTGEHRVLGRQSFRPSAMALDLRGERVAWGTHDGIVLEVLGAAEPPRGLPKPDGALELLAFVGDQHLVAMDEAGRASLLAIVDGAVVVRQTMTFEWGISNTAWRPAADETGGTIVLSTIKPGGPLHLLDVTPNTFSEPRQVPHSERSAWPESGRPRKASSREWLTDIGLAHPDLALRAAEVQRTEPDPTGRLIAVAQKTAHNEGFDETQSRWIVGPHDFVVTVYDRESRERLWTHAAPALTDLAWSGDGRRLGVTQDEAGYVLDATTGETLLERRDLGITATEPM